jgi:DnaJ-class molecular chaperone
MTEQKKFDQPGTKPMNPGDEAPAGTVGTGENICAVCRGSGKREGKPCQSCGGTGRVIEGVGGA